MLAKTLYTQHSKTSFLSLIYRVSKKFSLPRHTHA